MKGRAALAGLALLALVRPAVAAPVDDVRVGLFRYLPPARLVVRAAGPWHGHAGGRGAGVAGGRSVTVAVAGTGLEVLGGGHRLLAGPRLVLDGEGPWTLEAPGAAPRRVRGHLAIDVAAGALRPVLALPLEAYVDAVTGDEMPADWPAAALAVQAIAARSWTAAMRGRHAADGYDFCDLTHCQLFHGLASQDPRVTAAARASAGQVLAWHGRPIAAMWHSTCGGRTLPNDEVFGGEPLPYLRGGPDRAPGGRAWCADSPHACGWHVAYAAAEVAAALRESHTLATGEVLRGVSVADSARDGLPLAIDVDGSRRHVLGGYAFWMALGPHFGWGEVKSPRFRIARAGERLAFTGTGLGHLVGMCQWGARGRARAGWTWQRIAAAYFPGTAPDRLQR